MFKPLCSIVNATLYIKMAQCDRNPIMIKLAKMINSMFFYSLSGPVALLFNCNIFYSIYNATEKQQLIVNSLYMNKLAANESKIDQRRNF